MVDDESNVHSNSEFNDIHNTLLYRLLQPPIPLNPHSASLYTHTTPTSPSPHASCIGDNDHDLPRIRPLLLLQDRRSGVLQPLANIFDVLQLTSRDLGWDLLVERLAVRGLELVLGESVDGDLLVDDVEEVLCGGKGSMRRREECRGMR